MIQIDLSKLIITSHSIDNLFDYCARKFELAHLYENRPLMDSSGYAANVGTATHRGVQAWLIARATGLPEERARELGAFAFIKEFPWEESTKQKTNVRAFPQCAWLFQMILDHPFWDEWELVAVDVDGVRRWAVEVPWILIHKTFGPTNDGRYFATQGTIDLVMKNRYSGKICPIDIKTTIYDRGLTRAMYTHSGQQVGYGQVVESMLGNLITELDIIYFIGRISQSDPNIEIFDPHKDSEDLEDYWLDKMDRLERMKKYVNRKRFPRNNGGCHSFGYECGFFDICLTRDQDLLDAWFRDSPAVAAREHPEWWVKLEV